MGIGAAYRVSLGIGRAQCRATRILASESAKGRVVVPGPVEE
jgi:hypothetical protein